LRATEIRLRVGDRGDVELQIAEAVDLLGLEVGAGQRGDGDRPGP
jgi:hypothetical protein